MNFRTLKQPVEPGYWISRKSCLTGSSLKETEKSFLVIVGRITVIGLVLVWDVKVVVP